MSELREEAEKEQEEQKMKMTERLQILEKMIEGRLENQKNIMIAGERQDQEIHSGTIVDLYKQVNIKLSSKPSSDIGAAIHDFFSGNFLSGLEDLAGLAVNAVLGNESMGEYETSNMFIVWSNNALLRYDVYCYRWNFAAKGVIEDTEGVVGVLMIQRVVDLTKTDPQVLTWAISRQASILGDESKAKTMIADALSMLEDVMKFQAQVKKDELESNTLPIGE